MAAKAVYLTAAEQRAAAAEQQAQAKREEAQAVVRDVVEQMRLSHSCASGDLATARSIAETGGTELLSVPDLSGLRPLHHAAINGQTAVVEWLVESGADINGRTRNPPGNTPLHSAAVNGQVSALAAIIRLGADVTICNQASNTAEDLATRFGCVSVVRVLRSAREAAESKSSATDESADAATTADKDATATVNEARVVNAALQSSIKSWAVAPHEALPVPLPSLRPGVYPGPLQLTFDVPGYTVDEALGPDEPDPIDAARAAGSTEAELATLAAQLSRVVTVRATVSASLSVIHGEAVVSERPLILASPEDMTLVDLWKQGRMPEGQKPPGMELLSSASFRVPSTRTTTATPAGTGTIDEETRAAGIAARLDVAADGDCTPRLVPASDSATTLARIAVIGSAAAETGEVAELYDGPDVDARGRALPTVEAIAANAPLTGRGRAGVRAVGALAGAPDGAGFEQDGSAATGRGTAAPVYASSSGSDAMVILRGEAVGKTLLESEPVKTGGKPADPSKSFIGSLPLDEMDELDDDDDDDDDDEETTSDEDDGDHEVVGSRRDSPTWAVGAGIAPSPMARTMYDAEAEKAEAKARLRAAAAAKAKALAPGTKFARPVTRVDLPPPGKPHTAFVRAVAESRDGRVSAVAVLRYGLLRPLQHLFRAVLPPQLARLEGRLISAVGSASLDDALKMAPGQLRRRLKALGVRKSHRDALTKALRPLRDAAGHGEGMRPFLTAVVAAEREAEEAKKKKQQQQHQEQDHEASTSRAHEHHRRG